MATNSSIYNCVLVKNEQSHTVKCLKQCTVHCKYLINDCYHYHHQHKLSGIPLLQFEIKEDYEMQLGVSYKEDTDRAKYFSCL